jgi:hypothetical protein
MDSSGNATAIWTGSGYTVRVASTVSGGTWGQPATIGSGETARLAVDARGDLTAVWDDFFAAGGPMLQAAFRPIGESWGQPATLAHVPYFALGLQVVTDPSGDTMAAWENETYCACASTAKTAFRPAGGLWQPPITAASLRGTFQIALTSRARAKAVWSDNDKVMTSSSLHGGPWQAPVTIANSHAAVTGLQFVGNPRGDASAAWLRPQPSRGFYAAQVQGTIKPAQGKWQRSVPFRRGLSLWGETNSPAVNIDPRGNAVVAWIHPVGKGWKWVVEAASFTRHPRAARATRRRQ